MSSLLTRIQTARQAPPAAMAAPIASSVPTPSDAPTAPAPAPEPAYVPPPPVVQASEPASAANEVMSYLLNPPLPSARDRPEPEPEPEPAKEAPIAPPAKPRAVPVKSAKPRTLSAPRMIKTLASRPEALRMKTTPVIYARVPKTAVPANGAAPRTPDPEGSLTWLQFLAKSVQPGALHLLLAYYRRLGWVPSGAYGWLRDMCDGIARQTKTLTWESLRISPDRLVKIHAQSYRWLQAMFPPAPKETPHASNGHGALVVKKTSARRA